MRSALPRRPASAGFTLIEMLVVVFLLTIAMVGLLSVFDASARINKSEQDVADAQGAVRYGIYSMTRAIRMAGAGGLFVTQAVLNALDPGLPGVSGTASYDNVAAGTSVAGIDGKSYPVRPGTDMIEVRGVINSPLIGFDLATGCAPCDSTGCSPCQNTVALNAAAVTNMPHVNNDVTNRPQFSQIDAYTSGVTGSNPMYVIVSFNDDIHPQCSQPGPVAGQAYPLYPQAPYSVGKLSAPTTLVGSSTFGSVNFTDNNAKQFNTKLPSDDGAAAIGQKNVRHAGIMDDLIYFIDNTDPLHPALDQGTRRGDAFDVVTLADDVEDMQIAYGVDIDGNNEINILGGNPASFDSNVSSAKDGDEWFPNVAGEAPLTADKFLTPVDCPRLHAVMISLVAKSRDPDPTYKAPSALGFLTMNSPTTSPNPREYPGLSPATFRRRVQTLKINLRNYAYEGT